MIVLRTLLLLATLVIGVGAPTRADLPPPLQFPTGSSALDKSAAVEIIRADDRVERGRERVSQGAGYDTEHYCAVVLDIIATGNASGVLTVRGAATADLESTWQFDEIPPIHIVEREGTFRKSVVVPLRHNFTQVMWTVSANSPHGPLHVWATGVPCGASLKHSSR